MRLPPEQVQLLVSVLSALDGAHAVDGLARTDQTTALRDARRRLLFVTRQHPDLKAFGNIQHQIAMLQ